MIAKLLQTIKGFVIPALFILSGILLIRGCPMGGTGALVTGKGWSTDVVIHKGVIHTARYNLDEMSLEYAYKALTEDVWHKETVEKFERTLNGEKAYMIGGVIYGGYLRMAVDDSAVYIAYSGLSTHKGDGVLPGIWYTS